MLPSAEIAQMYAGTARLRRRWHRRVLRVRLTPAHTSTSRVMKLPGKRYLFDSFVLDSTICGINASFKSKSRLRPIANAIRQSKTATSPPFTNSLRTKYWTDINLIKERNRVEINPFYGTFATVNRSFSITSAVRLLLFRFQ